MTQCEPQEQVLSGRVLGLGKITRKRPRETGSTERKPLGVSNFNSHATKVQGFTKYQPPRSTAAYAVKQELADATAVAAAHSAAAAAAAAQSAVTVSTEPSGDVASIQRHVAAGGDAAFVAPQPLSAAEKAAARAAAREKANSISSSESSSSSSRLGASSSSSSSGASASALLMNLSGLHNTPVTSSADAAAAAHFTHEKSAFSSLLMLGSDAQQQRPVDDILALTDFQVPAPSQVASTQRSSSTNAAARNTAGHHRVAGATHLPCEDCTLYKRVNFQLPPAALEAVQAVPGELECRIAAQFAAAAAVAGMPQSSLTQQTALPSTHTDRASGSRAAISSAVQQFQASTMYWVHPSTSLPIPTMKRQGDALQILSKVRASLATSECVCILCELTGVH